MCLKFLFEKTKVRPKPIILYDCTFEEILQSNKEMDEINLINKNLLDQIRTDDQQITTCPLQSVALPG